jgi:hypothetical protein
MRVLSGAPPDPDQKKLKLAERLVRLEKNKLDLDVKRGNLLPRAAVEDHVKKVSAETHALIPNAMRCLMKEMCVHFSIDESEASRVLTEVLVDGKWRKG